MLYNTISCYIIHVYTIVILYTLLLYYIPLLKLFKLLSVSSSQIICHLLFFSWGKMYRDEITILAPLQQCCLVRHSTFQKLLLYDEGPYKLSELLDHSTSRDPLYPILVEGHLLAADRRVKIILKEIQNCLSNLSWPKVVKDDGF